MEIIYYKEMCEDYKTANEAGKFFGEQRMMKLIQQYSGLSIEKIGKNILNEVEQFIGTERLYDDLSMVILKRIN